MKATKLISVILILTTLCCLFVGCNQGDISDIELPERDFYELTVSFQIKGARGQMLFEAKDYKYKGHEEPTILNIISDYLVIVEDALCRVDKNNTLVQVGGTKATVSKGEYWAFMMNIDHDLQTILADQSALKKLVIDKKMSEYLIEDGQSFTVVLVTT